MKSVLILEDDLSVRSLLRTILEGAGFHVFTASTADEALQIARTHPTEIELLIADMVLPKSSGVRAARDLGTIVPDLRLLFMSGYPPETWNARFGSADIQIPPASLFLQKPFSPQLLSEKVRLLIGLPE